MCYLIMDYKKITLANLNLLGYTPDTLNLHINERILHFLILIINPDIDFRGCFPIHDRAQIREFKDLVQKQCESMKRTGSLPPETQIRKSDEFRGDRFDALVLDLSCAALEADAKRYPHVDAVFLNVICLSSRI